MSLSVIIIGIIATLAFVAAIIAIIIAVYFNQNKKSGTAGSTGSTGATGPTGPKGDGTIKGFTFDSVVNRTQVSAGNMNVDFVPGTLYVYNLSNCSGNYTINVTNNSNQTLQMGQSISVYTNCGVTGSTNLVFVSNSDFVFTHFNSSSNMNGTSVLFTVTGQDSMNRYILSPLYISNYIQ